MVATTTQHCGFGCAEQIQRTAGAADVLGADVGINLSGAQRCMPQQYLHNGDVNAGFEQVRGKAVPERVGRHFLGDACGGQRRLKHFAHGSRAGVLSAGLTGNSQPRGRVFRQ